MSEGARERFKPEKRREIEDADDNTDENAESFCSRAGWKRDKPVGLRGRRLGEEGKGGNTRNQGCRRIGYWV